HRRLARRMRLVGALMRLDVTIAMRDTEHPTRGDLKNAARSLDERIMSAVSAADLQTTLDTLDAIAEALGGTDALPLRGDRPGRGRGMGRDSGRRQKNGRPHSRRGHSKLHDHSDDFGHPRSEGIGKRRGRGMGRAFDHGTHDRFAHRGHRAFDRADDFAHTHRNPEFHEPAPRGRSHGCGCAHR
ncbi:MAG: hypothetical protein GX814_06755, partial [Microbacteriaceae bacterium]|nr:hypothetical protein [Microbacteriaceae bacterium]